MAITDKATLRAAVKRLKTKIKPKKAVKPKPRPPRIRKKGNKRFIKHGGIKIPIRGKLGEDELISLSVKRMRASKTPKGVPGRAAASGPSGARLTPGSQDFSPSGGTIKRDGQPGRPGPDRAPVPIDVPIVPGMMPSRVNAGIGSSLGALNRSGGLGDEQYAALRQLIQGSVPPHRDAALERLRRTGDVRRTTAGLPHIESESSQPPRAPPAPWVAPKSLKSIPELVKERKSARLMEDPRRNIDVYGFLDILRKGDDVAIDAAMPYLKPGVAQLAYKTFFDITKSLTEQRAEVNRLDDIRADLEAKNAAAHKSIEEAERNAEEAARNAEEAARVSEERLETMKRLYDEKVREFSTVDTDYKRLEGAKADLEEHLRDVMGESISAKRLNEEMQKELGITKAEIDAVRKKWRESSALLARAEDLIKVAQYERDQRQKVWVFGEYYKGKKLNGRKHRLAQVFGETNWQNKSPMDLLNNALHSGRIDPEIYERFISDPAELEKYITPPKELVDAEIDAGNIDKQQRGALLKDPELFEHYFGFRRPIKLDERKFGTWEPGVVPPFKLDDAVDNPARIGTDKYMRWQSGKIEPESGAIAIRDESPVRIGQRKRPPSPSSSDEDHATGVSPGEYSSSLGEYSSATEPVGTKHTDDEPVAEGLLSDEFEVPKRIVEESEPAPEIILEDLLPDPVSAPEGESEDIPLQSSSEEELVRGVEQTGLGANTKPLHTSDIVAIMNHFDGPMHGFMGVIPADGIPSLLEYAKATYEDRDGISFVMNTDPESQPGEHWVAVNITPDAVEYYDSYGKGPTKRTMLDLKALIDEIDPDVYLKFKTNRIVQQRANSNTCGYFALRFLLQRYRELPYKFCTGYSDIMKSEKLIERFRDKIKKEFPYI